MILNYFDETFFTRLKEKSITTPTGVSCGFCDNVFTADAYQQLRETFPDTKKFKLVDKADSGGGHKRFFVGPEYVITRNFGSVYHLRSLPLVWRELLNTLSSREFMQQLGEATNTEFNTMCNFGFGYGNEGCVQEPHLDGAIREGDSSWIKGNIAFLLYFNEDSDPVSATEVYDLDRKSILLKGTTLRNSLLFFKQHPNAWHGFPLVPKGHTRRIISLTYANAPEPMKISWSLGGLLTSKVKSRLYK